MIDILINSDGEMLIDGNDIVLGFSDYQHQEDLLVFQKGELKENVLQGVGIENYLNDGDIDGMLAETRSVYETDGMDVSKISFDEKTTQLDFDAKY